MITTTLSWIASQIDGTLEGDDSTVTAVSTDTRALTEGAVYLALKGANFNGHDFAEAAANAGASAIIASEKVSVSTPVIYVEDTKLALGQLGAAVKQQVAPKTIAITGSSGKTTVKEMCAAILSRRGKVLATQGNFNNDIGVPLTLLRLENDHEYAVMELGANHLGEIAYTTQLVKPNVATIVNAAASHLEGFGSLLGVARAKSEIFKGLDEDGTAIVNVDSQFADFWLGKLKRTAVLTFSPQQKNEADYSAEDITLGLDGCAEFMLCSPEGDVAVQLTIPGLHNVGNALVAAALTMQLGATLENVRDGLLSMQQVSGRLNVKTLTDQIRLLDDTYNANVASVNYHFGTKESLVQAVFARRLGPLNLERLKLLDQVERQSAGSAPCLESVLHAFVTPALHLRHQEGGENDEQHRNAIHAHVDKSTHLISGVDRPGVYFQIVGVGGGDYGGGE